MKIAYVNLHLDAKYFSGGVGRKIRSHVSIWQNLGHEAHLFLHTPDEMQFPSTTIFRYDNPTGQPLLTRVQNEVKRNSQLSSLIRAVRAYQPDIIYLRYGMYIPALSALYQVAPVVVEINTRDLAEYRLKGATRYWINRLTRGYIFSPATGMVAVTNELANLPENRLYEKPTLVLGNGIQTENFSVLPAPNNSIPHLLFIGTPDCPWHGVDQLIHFGVANPDIILDIVGYTIENFTGSPHPDNVRFNGFLHGEPLLQIMRQADCAMGTLALYINNMNEASTLKVREYVAYGIPTITPYEDTDLTPANLGTVLRIPNAPDSLVTDGQSVRNFVFNMRGKRVSSSDVAPLIDQTIKEQRRLAFFDQLIGQAKAIGKNRT